MENHFHDGALLLALVSPYRTEDANVKATRRGPRCVAVACLWQQPSNERLEPLTPQSHPHTYDLLPDTIIYRRTHFGAQVFFRVAGSMPDLRQQLAEPT